MKLALSIFGILVLIVALVLSIYSCLRIPKNLKGYYKPGYMILGGIAIVCGVLLILLGTIL